MTSKTTTKASSPKTDAQGRVMYKINMTTAASQLPSRETGAQRAAKLIYRSVIKKYGNS